MEKKVNPYFKTTAWTKQPQNKKLVLLVEAYAVKFVEVFMFDKL